MNKQMKIVVIGGSGLIGTKLVNNLRQHGQEVTAASPSSGVNTITGEGLAKALTGAQVVVDVSNAPSWEDKAVLEDCDMSDELLETLPLIAVLIEVAVFGWAFLRKNVSGVVLVNAIGAAAVIALIAPELKVSLQFVDVFFVLQVVIVAFALATLTTSFSWLIHPTGRSLAVWAEFSVLVGLSAALAIFFAVLQMARLG